MHISWTLHKIDAPRPSLSILTGTAQPVPLNRSKSAPACEKRFVSELYLNPQLEKYLKSITTSALIDLSYWNLTDQDMAIVVKHIFPSNQHDRILDLSGNYFTDQSMLALGTHLIKTSSIKTLNLSFNRLSNSGIRSLTQILSQNPHLCVRKLILNKNRIGDEGARCLANCLRTNQTLQELWLSDNEIGYAGMEQLTHVLAHCNKMLKVLVLSSNVFVTDRCINNLIKILKFNRTLDKLFIRDCNLTEKAKDLLCEEAASKRGFHLDI